MAVRQTDRLELFGALKETFGIKVTETLLQEFLSRDRETVALDEKLRLLDAKVDLGFGIVNERFNSVDTRLDTIENWIKVMVIGFLGFASSLFYVALQMR